MSVILTLAWLVAIVYATIPPLWLLIHPFAERWRAAKVAPAKSIGLLWLVLMIVFGLATAPWRHQQIYASPWSWLAWAALVGGGAAIYRRVGHFGLDNLIGRTELKAPTDQKLVTTGIHGRLRHPIYLAHLLMLTAWAVGTGLTVVWGLWAFAVLTGIFLIRTEDAELERRFGDEYRDYQRRVPAIFPFRRFPKPEAEVRNLALDLFEQLVKELPPGTATVSLNPGFGGAVIRPSNRLAAEIWGDGNDHEFTIGAGEGPWHQHMETAEEALSLCRWIMAGNLKLKITRRGSSVVSASLMTDENVVNTIIVAGSLNIFAKKTVEIRSYAPYSSDLKPASKPD